MFAGKDICTELRSILHVPTKICSTVSLRCMCCIKCRAVQCSTVQNSTVQYSTVQCIQYSAVYCGIV